MFMTTSCQFRAGKWTKKSSNLSSGAIDAEKLSKHMINSYESHPIDSRHVLCFDDHGHSYALGSDVSCSRRPVGKRSLNSAMPDILLKETFQQLGTSEKSDNKFKSVTYKEQEVFCAARMRGGKCTRFPGLTKEECPLTISVVEVKGLGLG